MNIIDLFQKYFVTLVLFVPVLVYFACKAFSGSKLCIQLGIILNPKFSENYYRLGKLLYSKNKNLADAEKALRQAINISSQDYRYYLLLANILHKSGRYDEALSNYYQVTKLDMLEDTAHLNIGLIFHDKLNNFTKAEKAYRDAIKANPKNPEGYFQLGWLLMDEFKRYGEAEELFLKTLEINPKDETAIYNLACIKSFNQDIEAAFNYLQQAIEKGFDKDWAKADKDLELLRNDLRFEKIIGLSSKAE